MADCILARAGAAPHRREQGPTEVTDMTAPTSSPSLVEPYFDAWNAHHPEPDRSRRNRPGGSALAHELNQGGTDD